MAEPEGSSTVLTLPFDTTAQDSAPPSPAYPDAPAASEPEPESSGVPLAAVPAPDNAENNTLSDGEMNDSSAAVPTTIDSYGTEQSLPQNGASESSVPLTADLSAVATKGVDIQALLDNIASTGTAPAADPVAAPTTAPQNPSEQLPEAWSGESASVNEAANLQPSVVNLPPSSIYSNGAQLAPIPETATSVPSFFQPPAPVQPILSPTNRISHSRQQSSDYDDAHPWTPETDRLYDEFLEMEKDYVSKGNWEQFPPDSRMFLGNLPTEKVHKRDIFRIFYKHGRLAQISLKQAYGFVQFLDTESCMKALAMEQGTAVRGRKMHLEISKPQKNTREDRGRGRRSLTPDDRGRGGRGSKGDRFDGRRDAYTRDGHGKGNGRRGDDYRPRSPSPRGLRRDGRDRSRDRYGRARSRSRSPYGRRRSISPKHSPPRDYDEDADLPLPRRAAGAIPEIQMIVMDELDRNFIAYIEKAFRDRGIRSDVLFLNPRLNIAAVIKRQIIEGVLAVSCLTKLAQNSTKIPLQVFDRRESSTNVRYDEYENLDPATAAELLVRAKQYTQPAYPPPAPPAYQQPYGGYAATPQVPQVPQVPPAAAAPANLAGILGALDGPALQKLLSTLQPQAAAPQAAPQPNLADLAALLGARPASNPQANPYQPPPTAAQNPYAAFASNPALAGLLGSAAVGARQQPLGATQTQPAQQVQNIMEQLAKWKQ